MPNTRRKLLVVAAGLLVIAALVALPVIAQDAPPGPGEGGIIIEGNFGGDPATMNYILYGDTASGAIIRFIIPGLIGVNPDTADYEKNRYDALVTDWTVSEDGKTYTFKLRDDWTWSDGTPITSADSLYTWNAIKSGVVDVGVIGYLVDVIDTVEAPDPTTLVVTFKEADCTAIGNAASLSPVPSHILPTDFAELNNADYNMNPTVSGGVFKFAEFRAGEQVSLLANQSYGGAPGAVIPTGYIYKNVPDQNVLVAQFKAGELNVIDNPAVGARADLVANPELNMYSYPGNAWDYLALNYADPTNPQSAYDADGNPIDQGHHPLFGDLRVREAVAKAIDVDAIIQGAVFGEGVRMPAYTIPASWAFNKDLPVIAQDVEAAKALLDEAGFVDHDNDPNTPRVCQGCLYAAEGTPLRFTLYTNEGNARRTAVGTIVQDELKQVGFEVDFQTIDFNTLLDIMDAQTFDAFILGWRQGYPDDPDLTQIFASQSDVVGTGSNNVSYNNPKFDELNLKARTLPGCDPAERAKIYYEIQELMQKDLPYIPLYAINGMYGARKEVQGFDPRPSNWTWNIETWYIKAATP